MPEAIGKIGNYYSVGDLKDFVDILEGKKAAPLLKPAPAAKLMPVIIKAPENQKSDSFQKTVAGLKNFGLKNHQSFASLETVAGELSPQKARELQKAGFQVFEDKMLEILPAIPGGRASEQPVLTATSAKPWDRVKVDPVKMLKLDQAREIYGLTGKGRTVAVIDSGFNHQGYELKAWKDCTSDKSETPIDPCGHGTHVTSDVLKMAPEAEIIGIRVMNEQGMGMNSWIINGLQWAIQNKEKYGIDVINLSFGSRPNPIHNVNVINDAVRKTVEAGLTVVISAGNLGPKSTTVGPPGELIPVITVGSARDEKTVSDFSSRGPTMHDDAPKPDITAPGQYIVSWMPADSTLGRSAQEADRIRAMSREEVRRLVEDNPRLIERMKLPRDILTREDNEVESIVKNHAPKLYVTPDGRVAADGTSFSSPEVAGISALLKQANPSLTHQEIKTILMDTAEDMGEKYSRLDQGKGFVNVKKALDEAEQRRRAEEKIPAYLSV